MTIIQGASLLKTFFAVTIAVWAAPLFAQYNDKTDQKVALVIGNNAYQNSRLVNSVNDANAIARVLRRLDFAVDLVTDATSKTMKEVISRFVQSSSRENTISVLYYSGHGIQIRDRNVMLGIDVRPDKLEDFAVDVQDVFSRVKAMEGAVHLVILDACREYVASPSSGRGLLPIDDVPAGTMLAFSTAPGRLASDGNENDRNGLYTKYLIKHLNAPGTTVEGVFKKVRFDVISETKGEQVPWENSSLLRDFYFNPAPSGFGATSKQHQSSQLSSVTVEQAMKTLDLAPSDKLSDLYALLGELSTGHGGSKKVGSNANTILLGLTGIRFSEIELEAMAKSIVNVGTVVKDIPEYSRKLMRLSEQGGVLVHTSTIGRPAFRAGMREGDVILRVNGKVINGRLEFQAAANLLHPGETFNFTVFRNGKTVTFSGVIERASIGDLVYASAAQYGEGTNDERVGELLQWAANRSHAESLAILAHMTGQGYLYRKPGGMPDYEKAFDYAQRASAYGSQNGLYWMAVAYQEGWGVERSFDKANELRRKAADQNAAWGINGLGSAYLNGWGVSRDYERARMYFELASAQDYFDGLVGLARMYENGLGGPRDLVEARIWYGRANAAATDPATGSRQAIEFTESKLQSLH